MANTRQSLTAAMMEQYTTLTAPFDQWVAFRLGSGLWTIEALALSIKNEWLAGRDMRIGDIERDIRAAWDSQREGWE